MAEGRGNAFERMFRADAAQYCTHVKCEQLQYMVNISLKHRYLYFENAKAACTTIKATLRELELGVPIRDEWELRSLHGREYSPLLRPSQVGNLSEFLGRPDIFRFTFVRNPYTRILSCYLDKILRNRPPKRIILSCLGLDPADREQPISFDQYVGVICDQEIIDMNTHWRIQYYQTCQELISYDYIGKVESFEDDFRAVLARLLGGEGHTIRMGTWHSTGAASRLENYYTAELARKILLKYEKDFQKFGYDPDISMALKPGENLNS